MGCQVHKICYDTRPLKTIHALEFLQYAGFSNIKVKGEQIEIKWNDLVAYCSKNETAIRTAFKCEKRKKFEGEKSKKFEGEINSELKKSLMHYVNSKLESVFGVKIKRLHDRSLSYYLEKCFLD